MSYTYSDYVRDNGRAPARYHRSFATRPHWTKPLLRYWSRHTYDGPDMELQDGRKIKQGETLEVKE